MISHISTTSIYLWTRLNPNASGVECEEEGSTTKSLVLKPSYWRTGPRSQDVRECPDANLGEGVSSCIGTLDDDGKRREDGSLCRPGTKGPYCQVCSEPDHYMVDSECIECDKRGEDTSMVSTYIWAFILFLLLVLYVCWLKVRA